MIAVTTTEHDRRIQLCAEHDPHIVPWEDMDEQAKRNHLVYSHGYTSAEDGGFTAAEGEDTDGPDAWIGKGCGSEHELDSLHEDDHANSFGGGGHRTHFHPGAQT